MGQDSSKPVDAPTFVSLSTDIMPDDMDGAAAPTEASSAAGAPPPAATANARAGEGSFDQLPSMPPEAVDAPGSAIARDLGDYRLEKHVLGEGAFGKVRLATSVRTGHRVAVKVIKRKKLNDRAEVLLTREVRHHEKLRHANIVRLHTFIMTPNKYYLVMEYCEGGDLLHYINSTALLSDELARTLFRGLVDGIRFCHVLGIHHRDLKLENLMLTSLEPEKMQLKIADFGLSDLQTLPSSLSATFCGSPLYAAPELMTAGAAPDGYNASKSDVWSCGVVLYALLASALPFDAEDICALVRLIQRGVPNSPVPESRGPAAARLVAVMLTVDPKTRPTATEVLTDSWVNPPPAPKGIKASITTIDLQDRPAAATGAIPDTVRERPRRQIVSFNARSLKEALAAGNLEEEGETTPQPRARPPAESADGAAPLALPTPPPPSAPAVAPPATCNEVGGDTAKRLPGQVLTRAEMAAIKAKGGETNEEEHSSPSEGGVSSTMEAEAGASSSSAPSAAPPVATRKGGTQFTKDEWDEIKREMAEKKERKEKERQKERNEKERQQGEYTS